MLKETSVLARKPSFTPFDPSLKLLTSDGQELQDPTLYQKLIVKLIYLTNTRPNISYDVQRLSQYVSYPLLPHYQEAMKVLRYLKLFSSKGILFSTNNTFKLYGCADLD